METKLNYLDLTGLIDLYIDQYGIARACADILHIVQARLYTKSRMIEHMLDRDSELDSIPSGADGKANPNPASPEEILSRNSAERAVPSSNLDGFTLILEREYRK